MARQTVALQKYLTKTKLKRVDVVELVDTLSWGGSGASRGSSSLPIDTNMIGNGRKINSLRPFLFLPVLSLLFPNIHPSNLVGYRIYEVFPKNIHITGMHGKSAWPPQATFLTSATTSFRRNKWLKAIKTNGRKRTWNSALFNFKFSRVYFLPILIFG